MSDRSAQDKTSSAASGIERAPSKGLLLRQTAARHKPIANFDISYLSPNHGIVESYAKYSNQSLTAALLNHV